MRFVNLIAAALVLTIGCGSVHLHAAEREASPKGDAKAAQPAAAQDATATKAKLPYVRGVVASIDAATNSITVRVTPKKGAADTSPVMKTVTVGDSTALLLGDKTAKLTDLKVGDPIFVRYDDKDVATSVRDHRAMPISDAGVKPAKAATKH